MKESLGVILDVIYEHDAISMVNLVLKNPGQKVLGGYPYVSPLLVKSVDSYFAGAWYFAINIGYAQTAFKIFYNFAFVFGDDRVYEDGEGSIFFVVKIITNYDNPQSTVNLYCRQSNPNFVASTIFPIKC